MRNGKEVLPHLTSHLMGALAGNPHAELAGELEAMTEQAERRAKVGPRRVHLFDCLHDGTRSLVRAPYSERRDALWRMNAAVQCYAPDDDHRPRPWQKYRDPSVPGWKLCPVIEQVPVAQAARAWEDWVIGPEDGDEGLVAVDLTAPVGRPAAKLKIKTEETIDATVTLVARTMAVCSWNGHVFAVGRTKLHLEVGDVVEVRHAGWYETVLLPRFPAIVRVRRDLQ
jgi:ATP-dependent DNA ligase